MIMQNAVLFYWIQAYDWARPLKQNASKCRHELGKVNKPGGQAGQARPGQARTTRSTSGDCQSSGLGAQMPGPGGDQLKYSEMSIDVNSK